MAQSPSSSKSLSLPPCIFSCRIVVIDYYLASPLKHLDVCFSDFRCSPVEKVPVIRIFGATPTGQKSCLHVHGVFPYLLVPCLVVEPTDSYLQQLARSIDHALQVSLGASSRTANHVFKIVVVKGIPFYGYHESEELFLRIYLVNPGLIKRLAELLLAGAVMNQVLQPHESHIPYHLQFMIDYNLFGMNHIHLSAVKFRVAGDLEGSSSEVRSSPSQTRRRRSLTSPLLSPLSASCSPSLLFHPSQTVWDTNTLPSHMILCEPRKSVTELEVDVLAVDILNRHELSLVSDGYPGLAAIWEEERQRRVALKIDDPLSPPPSPDRASQPYHLEEQRLREIFVNVLKDRLGTSYSAELASFTDEELMQSTPGDDITFSQSCDLDLHHPIELEDGAGSEPVVNGNHEVVVDEEAIKQSMELSQRLSRSAIEKSTDAEMLELMAELCQTPIHTTALSQSHSQSQFQSLSQCSQSVGEQLASKLKRSHSILSARSLFSSESQDEDSEDSDEDNLENVAPRRTDKEDDDAKLEGAEFDDQLQDSGDDLFVALETELGDRKFSSPVVKISTEEERQRTLQPPVSLKLNTDGDRKAVKNSPSTLTPPKSAVRHGVAGPSDAGEESEVELPIATPLTSPIPPSPKSKEQQGDILHELDSFGSDEVGRELGVSVSQFDISFSQIQTPPSRYSAYTKTHPELEKVWNSSTSDTQSPLGLVTEETAATKRSSEHNVQLEYDMPEITASQLETSSDPLFNPLEADSPQTSLEKGQQSSSKKGMTSSLCKAERQLLLKPLASEGVSTKARKEMVSGNKSEDIPQLDGVNDEADGHKSSRKRKRTLGLRRGNKKRRTSIAQASLQTEACGCREDIPECAEKEGHVENTATAVEEKEMISVSSDTKDGGGNSTDSVEAHSDSKVDGLCQSTLKEEVASWGAEVDVTSLEAQETAEEAVSVEKAANKASCQDGETSTRRATSSSDESQHSREKSRHRLSLRKTVSKIYRTRERLPRSRRLVIIPRKWRSAEHLIAKALRSTCVVKIDRLPHLPKNKLQASTHEKPAVAEQPTCDVAEPTKTRLNLKIKNRSPSRSESEDNLSSGSMRETRGRTRGTRRTSSSQYFGPVMLRTLSFEQQLKRAIEMSKELYLAESAKNSYSNEVEVEERSSEQREEASSPLIFSPPPPDDLNRTVVEESPLEDELDSNTSHDQGEIGVAGNVDEWNLDMTISNISESPPFNICLQERGGREEGEGGEGEEILQDSTLKLELETSFTEVSPPPQSSSPVNSKPPNELEMNYSFANEDKFPVVKLTEKTDDGETAVGVPMTTEAVATTVNVGDGQEQKLLIITKSHDLSPLPSLPASPESILSQSEVEQLLPSQVDLSTDDGFHLAYSSSSEEEVGGAMSPDSQDFSIEKTSLSVRLASSLVKEEGEEKPLQNQLPQRDYKAAVAGEDVGVVGGEAGEKCWVCPALDPPSLKELTESASNYNLPSMRHQQPFYSCPADAQRPLVIGGKTLRVPSKMPYDLKEFHVVYSRDGESENAQFSSVGLHHMRTVLSMLSSGTQPVLPPVCHPISSRMNRTSMYSFEEYKRDMELRASFFPPDKVVITPALPPPHPDKFTALLLKAGVADKNGDTEEGRERERGEGHEQEGDERGKESEEEFKAGDNDDGGGGADLTKSMNSSLQLASPMSTAVATSVEEVEADIAVPLEEKGDSRKSPSICRSDASLNSPVHDSSLTSYQVPSHHEQSTPMVMADVHVGGSESEAVKQTEEEEQREEREISTTPVRQKNSTVPKLRPLLPFTPIHAHPRPDHSQLEGPTPNNPFGFKVSQSALPGSCDIHDVQFLTSMSVELHVRTRASLRPDPDFDPVLAIFYYIHNDWPPSSSASSSISDSCPSDGGGGGGEAEDNVQLGIIAIDIDNCDFGLLGNASPVKSKIDSDNKSPSKVSSPSVKKSSSPSSARSPPTLLSPSFSSESSLPGVRRYFDGCGLAASVKVLYVSSELELIKKLVQLVRQVDPDFLLGYEITMASWGYLIERAAKLDINLTNELSRMPSASHSDRGNHGDSWWKTMLNITGRIMFGVWRMLKHEIALTSYSFENVVYHILHRRIPNYSWKTLTSWYDHFTSLYRHRVVEHYLMRCQGNLQLLESFNLIGRTSEFSRLYGIEFESVVNRGSQYRVESMMLRLAKPANFIPVSPSVQQRARMAAPECLPLILEPESKFYADPVLVLDFQSLYPSMVIAYNYCFSTCLGKVHNLAAHGNFQFGASSLNVPNSVLKKLKDKVHISPNGVVFVKHHVRRGILTRMLEEILGTRIMVKGSMKKHKQNKGLERMLNARQLGLKLIANTTYGYTGASFCGRMPCIEVADSIVRKGRETLELAIQMVNSSPEWRAKVVYGDTDSLFVLLKGASKEEAFRIGKEICDRITESNPKPVKLKFEKVYLPCVLQTKKRYVGFMYESLDQKEPEFDAKGIETVRRDGCPAVAKVLEKSLKLLYSSRDVSLVKNYVQRQFKKVLEGRVDLRDYTFAKEYRGRQYYRPGASVPCLELTKQGLLVDRRSEPRMGERVPYVIVYGTPSQPLIQLVRRPEDLLDNPGLRLNGVYYITKQLVPALERCFSLLGVDVRQWYSELPQVRRAPAHVAEGGRKPRGTIGQYFATMHCPVCEQLTVEGVCAQCKKNPAKVATTLSVRMRDAERTCCDIETVCRSCLGSFDSDFVSACISLDCPINYRRYKAAQEKVSLHSLRRLLSET